MLYQYVYILHILIYIYYKMEEIQKLLVANIPLSFNYALKSYFHRYIFLLFFKETLLQRKYTETLVSTEMLSTHTICHEPLDILHLK